MPFVLGVNHAASTVDVRERLSVAPWLLPEFLGRLKSGAEVDGVVALSTCNRLELYVQSGNRAAARDALCQALSRRAGLADLGERLYYHESEACVTHLFRVASGLDSMVRGEHEILGQVKQAYQAAQEAGFTGKLLNVLFQRSMHVGKRVRTETGVSIGAGSVGSVAVQLAGRIFGSLEGRVALVLGAGQMAEATGRHLLSQKVRALWVATRTFENACALADRLGGAAMHFEDGLKAMAEADVVICSTSAPHPVITRDHVRRVMEDRNGRSLFLIDIAVPRDVEPAVNDLDNVYLFNVDDLQRIVAENESRRAVEIERAEAIVSAETREFVRWLRAERAGLRQGLKHYPILPSAGKI